jgi:hypothetical protein
MKTITTEFLEEHSACSSGLMAFNNNYPSGKEKLDTIINDCIKSDKINNLQYANWLLTRIFSRKQKIKYAIFAAESVIKIFETKYPNNDKPRKAIEAAKTVLKSDTKGNRKLAAYAAADAYAAAAYDDDAAAAAAAAAYDDAAYAAAYAVAYAAYAVAYAAYAYAAYAAADAAYAAAAYAADAAYAYAAYAAAAYDDDAAAAAYDDADAADARKELMVKILKYGMDILTNKRGFK